MALHGAAVDAFHRPAGAGSRGSPGGRSAVERPRPGLPLRARHGLGLPQRAQALRPVTAAAMFPGSFHALRHAFATIAVAVLPSDAAVATVMGHRRKATTVDLLGAPGGTRTPNRPGRNRLLYPLSYGRRTYAIACEKPMRDPAVVLVDGARSV